MQPSDAMKLAARLKSAFPRMTLDEEEGEMFVSQLALLADPLICNEAIDGIIRREERFPTIATIRLYYRTCADSHRPPALPETTARTGIPEWVQVWRWQMARTLTERQAERTGTRLPIADRTPVKMRDFPQSHNPGPDAYTMDEYEQIRADWRAAGSPTMSADQLLTV